MSTGVDLPQGLQSNPVDSSEDLTANSPTQTKSKPGPVLLGLTRCAACYNLKKRTRRGSCDGESSSSAEDSGPEVDWESEAESSSSSSSSEEALSEAQEKAETEEFLPEQEETPELEAEAGAEAEEKTENDRQEETGEMKENQEDRGITKKRAPLIKSYSLPSSFPPHLIPWSLLPRPPTVISSLHLQVSQEYDDNPFLITQQPQSEQVQPQDNYRERINNPPYPQTPIMNRSLWQQGSLPTLHQQRPPYPHQHYQQQPQHFDPPSAQGQIFPPPPLTLPVLHPQLHTLNAPPTHLHAPPPQPCWYCYSTQYPYAY